VVAGQVGVGARVAQVVDGDDLDVMLLAAFVVGAQNVAADAAIAIDGNTYGHWDAPFCKTCSTVLTTRCAVRSKCLNSAPAGADSPKPSRPTTAPSRPTYLYQPDVEPASMATRGRPAGSTCARQPASCRSN